MPSAAVWTSPRVNPGKSDGDTSAVQRVDSEKPPLLAGVKVKAPTDKVASTV